jgi:hypothetical protein
MIRKLLIINYSLLVIFSGCSFKNSNQEEHFFPKSTSKDNLIFGTTTNKNLITVSGVLKNVRYLESKNKWVYKISNQKKDFVFISKHQIPYVNYDVEAKFDEKKTNNNEKTFIKT